MRGDGGTWEVIIILQWITVFFLVKDLFLPSARCPYQFAWASAPKWPPSGSRLKEQLHGAFASYHSPEKQGSELSPGSQSLHLEVAHFTSAQMSLAKGWTHLTVRKQISKVLPCIWQDCRIAPIDHMWLLPLCLSLATACSRSAIHVRWLPAWLWSLASDWDKMESKPENYVSSFSSPFGTSLLLPGFWLWNWLSEWSWTII